MIEQRIQRFSVRDSQTGEELKVLRPVPMNGDAWGVFESIKDTDVGKLIPVVSGEDFSQALHGRFLALKRNIGREPKYQIQKITSDMTCGLIDSCILADRAKCYPCKNTPHCYQTPGFAGLQDHAISTIVRAWADDRYVVVVEGPEFSY